MISVFTLMRIMNDSCRQATTAGNMQLVKMNLTHKEFFRCLKNHCIEVFNTPGVLSECFCSFLIDIKLQVFYKFNSIMQI